MAGVLTNTIRLNHMEYEQAKSSNEESIKNLLESHGLPASDINDHLGNFIVAKESSEIVGVGGFEICNDYALLRSFAVNSSHKGLGIAEQIFNLVEEQAIKSGIKAFYLLTDTASQYFERLAFYECSRDIAPESIRNTKQFSGLCPDTATMMCKVLVTVK